MTAQKTLQTKAPKTNKGLQSELVQLEAWAQEELASQAELSKALNLQEAAVRAGSTEDLLAGTKAVESATRNNVLRERRRVAGLRTLARRFGVAVETLTLQSISERVAACGLDVSRLDRMRADMRVSVADALRRGRRIASLARQHRSLMDNMFREIAEDHGTPSPTGQVDSLLVNRAA